MEVSKLHSLDLDFKVELGKDMNMWVSQVPRGLGPENPETPASA